MNRVSAKSMKQRNPKLTSSHQGFAVVLTVIGITAFLGMAALAIDFGMLFSAQSEAQRAADAAAVAGASFLADHPDEAEGARTEALELARANLVRNEVLVIGEDDVSVDLSRGTVTVEVHRNDSHGGGVKTFFAQGLGLDEVDIYADATARVFGAQAIQCALPLVVPDRWDNVGSNGFDPDEGDRYAPHGESGTTGYSSEDIGEQIVLVPEQSGQGNNNNNQNNNNNNQNNNNQNNNAPPNTSSSFGPNWSGWWSPDGDQSTNNLTDWTKDCENEDLRFQKGQWGEAVPGRRQAVINNGFQDLINEDPNAHWDSSCQCVQGGEGMQSPRIRPLVLFDPRTFQSGGSDNFQFVAFASVFVEESTGPQGQQGVKGRLMSVSGFQPVAGGGTTGGQQSLNTLVRLVE